jgi:hypothetical protein
VKKDLEELIRVTSHAVGVWVSSQLTETRFSEDFLRPSFVAHRLVCALEELGELLSVHQLYWPHDRLWRDRHGTKLLKLMDSKEDTIQAGVVVAQEEWPDRELANSHDLGDLFEFFCQVRKAILFTGNLEDKFDTGENDRGLIDTAMNSLRNLDRTQAYALERALTAFLQNSYLHPNARLQNGIVLGVRYRPLFQAIQILRGENDMNMEEIQRVLRDVDIKPETKIFVDKLIDALRQVLSDLDLDQIRDILASGGQLFPGMGDDGNLIIIPGDGKRRCAPVILAIAIGKDSRSRYGLPKVMRSVRAHLIECFEIAEVVVLITDRWDPDIMKESEADFSAHASRSFGRKVLIPIVSWKRNLSVFNWP